MDAIYDYLTTKPVNYTYRMPQKGHCMSRVLFNLPTQYSIDGRGEHSLPDYTNLLPDSALLLFPRHVVYNMATKLGRWLSEYPSIFPHLQESVVAAEWMAGKEREILWPLLAHHYLNMSESHGANKTTGPELKMADASSTYILFVHRVEWSSEMLNWEEFRDTLSAVLSSRGYSFQFVNPIDMTAEEQVLVSSRATLYLSVHGSNLANMVWMNPRATTLEIASKYMDRLFFEKVAADYNTFYMKYVDQYDAGPNAGLLHLI
jgi:capsular polysaccharide biosynthesis protein